MLHFIFPDWFIDGFRNFHPVYLQMSQPLPKDRLDQAIANDKQLIKLRKVAENLKADGQSRQQVNAAKRKAMSKTRHKLTRRMVEGKYRLFHQPARFVANMQKREQAFRLAANEFGLMNLRINGLINNCIRAVLNHQNRVADLHFRIGWHTRRVEDNLRRILLVEQRRELHKTRRARAQGLPV